MATYVMLMNLTDQGVKGIKDAPNRRAAAEKMIADLGGTVVQNYLTMGSYDRVMTIDLPDDAAAAKCALGFGAFGNVRTTTLRAFDADETMAIVGSL